MNYKNLAVRHYFKNGRIAINSGPLILEANAPFTSSNVFYVQGKSISPKEIIRSASDLKSGRSGNKIGVRSFGSNLKYGKLL